MQRMKRYPVEKCKQNELRYPPDKCLLNGWRYASFEQPGSELLVKSGSKIQSRLFLHCCVPLYELTDHLEEDF